jgi:hypothetical protein
MVTARWTRDAQGHFLGYGRMPNTIPDPSLPQAWNRSGKTQTIHAPEKMWQSSVWGTRQIALTLPGSSSSLSLADIAGRLNQFKRPDEFLSKSDGETVRVRVTLQDVRCGANKSGKLGEARFDLQFTNVDITAKDWKSIFQDATPLKQKFGSRPLSDYPILQVEIQQSLYAFQTD